MFKNKAVMLMASAMLAMPALVNAQGTPTAGKGGTVSGDQLVVRYTTLAGSEKNAKSLVNGLRTGDDITLVGDPVTTKTFLREEAYAKGATLPSDGLVRELVRTEQRQIGTGPCPTTTTTAPRLSGPGVPPPPPSSTCPIYATFDVYNVYQIQTVEQKEIFSPKPAAPMGFGNVDIALALTEAKLGSNTKPKVTELKGNLVEILTKRANGEGWGEIAKSYGFELK